MKKFICCIFVGICMFSSVCHSQAFDWSLEAYKAVEEVYGDINVDTLIFVIHQSDNLYYMAFVYDGVDTLVAVERFYRKISVSERVDITKLKYRRLTGRK